MNDPHVEQWQRDLREAGHYAGEVDGDFGPGTLTASRALLPAKPTPPVTTPPPVGITYPHQDDMTAFYGPAGAPACTAGSVRLPFAFPLAWDASQKVTRFACHAKLAAPFTSLFDVAADHYGETEFRRLRLDLFGGCYNYRRMRGGTRLSIHAWGAAIDLDPIRNQLGWGRDKAAFAGPDYKPFWQIVDDHGFTSLGLAANRDFMHLQACSL